MPKAGDEEGIASWLLKLPATAAGPGVQSMFSLASSKGCSKNAGIG